MVSALLDIIAFGDASMSGMNWLKAVKRKYPGWDAPYEEMAGKVGRVLSYNEDSNGHKTVRMNMEESGKTFRGTDNTVSLNDQAILVS